MPTRSHVGPRQNQNPPSAAYNSVIKSASFFLLPVFILATAGLAYFGWREHREIAALRTAAAGQVHEVADLSGQLSAAGQKVRNLEDALAARRRASASDEAGGAEAPQRRAAAGRARLTPAERLAAMAAALNDPDIQRALAVRQRSAVDTRYAALFKSLNLPPDQLARLQTLLTERQSVVTDAIAAALQQGESPFQDLDGFRQIVANAQAEVNSSIQAAIGDSAYAQLTNYDETILFRNATNRLQNDLIATNNALSGQQLGSFTNGIVSLAQSQFTPSQLQALQQLDQAQQIRLQLAQVQQLYQQSQASGVAPPGH